MQTMSSLEAQNNFAKFVDTALREPVVLTRRGRPVSMMISASGDPVDLQYQFTKALSTLMPLRGQEALAELSRVLAPARARARADGLTQKALIAALKAKS
jgi:antitoxin (DNA-binding transcriptional repressor) of toxin-antitoxin stability system